MSDKAQARDRFESDKFKAYEDGKHRRYELFFAVNGGAFAVAKLFAETQQREGPNPLVLGHLNLQELSFGMMLFTIVMVADIFAFGWKMSRITDVFGWPGRIVLIFIGALVFTGWLLVMY